MISVCMAIYCPVSPAGVIIANYYNGSWCIAKRLAEYCYIKKQQKNE